MRAIVQGVSRVGRRGRECKLGAPTRVAASYTPLTMLSGAASPRRHLAGAAGGPDAPSAVSSEKFVLPRWPAGWHDHLQYHFFSEHFFAQARVFLTPTVEEHSLWIFDHKEGKVVELVNSCERMTQGDSDGVDLSGPQLRIQDGPGGGVVRFERAGGGVELEVRFRNRNVFSWLPGGQTKDAVIHRPNLEHTITYKGQEHVGRGYSKRYFGSYGPHWGYRFIQSSWLGDRSKFLWTADATFRLGDGEAKYNYFKLLDETTGELTQADSRDTYQQDSEGFAEIGGEKYVARVTPLGEWLHDIRSPGNETNSRMQLRYCKINLTTGTGEALEGYALNERCFGVLG